MVRPHCIDEKVRLRKPWFLAITVIVACNGGFFFPLSVLLFICCLAVLGLCCSLGFPLVAASGECSLVAVCALLIALASRCGAGLSGTWASDCGSGSVAEVPQPCCSVAYVVSSQIRGQTCVSCFGRWVLYH